MWVGWIHEPDSFFKMGRGLKKDKQRKIAVERIRILMGLADKSALCGDLGRADDYVMRVRDIGMRYNVRLPRELKRRFCRYCYHYLLPQVTSNVRINSRVKRVEIRCLNCNRVMFYPYIREVKERRRKENV